MCKFQNSLVLFLAYPQIFDELVVSYLHKLHSQPCINWSFSGVFKALKP